MTFSKVGGVYTKSNVAVPVNVREPLSWNSYNTPNLYSLEPSPVLQVADLKIWFSADRDVTLVSGNVSVWGDKSLVGGLQSISQATAANRPAYVVADPAFNNLSSINFDGTNDRLQDDVAADVNFLHDGTGCTMFAVIKVEGVATDQYSISTFGPEVSDPGISLIYNSDLGYYRHWRLFVRNEGAFVINVNTGAESVKENSTNIVTYRYLEGRPGNEYDLRLDSVVKASGNTLDTPSSADGTILTFGCLPFTVNDAFSSCRIAEVIMYTRYLTDAETIKIEEYLRLKYRTPAIQYIKPVGIISSESFGICIVE